ncbi:Tll0287-like domain-containing protein [Marinicellulosiphila megalodicopiae]|uniref:Tll0287-like domain-containing protein n=1 Tax=Marinicellulosiphila megalodicopiae TaxID=2724896 RepID=UPI003BAEEEF1
MLNNISFRIRFIFVLLIMLLLNGFAYFSIFKDVYEEELRTQARIVVNNVESFSAWVNSNGGVWVTNDRSYLGHRSLLDATTQEPVEMYSKNPALATREYSEQIAQSNSPATFRMTSENYMNPKNKPDSFESEAIISISSQNADSEPEYFKMVNGKYRYAKPVYHKAGCIRCHGRPEDAPASVINFPNRHDGFGFQTGDLAGVISVELQTESFSTRLVSVLRDSIFEISLVVLSFCLVLWFVWMLILKPINSLAKVADAVSKGQPSELNSNHMNDDSKNEVYKLTIALSRLKNSYEYTADKYSNLKTIFDKAKLRKQERKNKENK